MVGYSSIGNTTVVFRNLKDNNAYSHIVLNIKKKQNAKQYRIWIDKIRLICDKITNVCFFSIKFMRNEYIH